MDSSYLFPMENGTPFDGNSFRKIVWNKALSESQIACKTPYSTRHTFLRLGAYHRRESDEDGQSDRAFVKTDGVSGVRWLRRRPGRWCGWYYPLFREGFLIKPGKKMSPLLVFGDSYGDSQNPIQLNYWIVCVLSGAGNGIQRRLIKYSVSTNLTNNVTISIN